MQTAVGVFFFPLERLVRVEYKIVKAKYKLTIE